MRAPDTLGGTSGMAGALTPALARARDGERPIGSKCQAQCRPPVRSQAHCSVCHRTFSGMYWFDEHRVDGWCVEPETLGLVERDRLWTTPAGHAKRARLAAQISGLPGARGTQ